MKAKSLTRLNRIINLLIFTAMSVPMFSQDYPSFDTINTTAGVVEMHFIGHGSLLFKLKNFTIYIDPVRTSGSYDNLPKASLILVTHEHSDHLDTDLIDDLRQQGTVLLCNEKSAVKVSWAQILRAGDKNIVDGITIETIPAYNIKNMRTPGQPFHPKGSGNGYIISIGDKRFYIAGDTENIPEMKVLKNIDVAFLPMNMPYTMTPEMVADAARSFKPEILYPYHYGDTDTGEIINLLKDTQIIVRIRKLE
jgi:L-ascorbate metabolism protein UlaG (beta-lactamase superfamily)